MGWFGFGGSRSRDDRSRADARSNSDRHFTHEAVRIDRAGKPSRLPDDRPRRRDREDRWERR
jgi:hypothetical protein